jgi:hypothetical protein
MKPHKPSFLADLYRKVGEGLGFVVNEEADGDETGSRSVEDVKRAMAASESLRARAQRLKLGLTDEDIVALCKAGRR